MARPSSDARLRECLAAQYTSEVPIQLDLAASEVVDASSNAPPALYVCAFLLRVSITSELSCISNGSTAAQVLGSRSSYLPSLAAQALASFQHVLLPTTERRTPWFSFQHSPLKWQYPIGVLFDLHAAQQHVWRLTVHFRDFPAEHLMQYDGEESMQTQFFMSLKEAAFICMRSAHIVQNMTSTAHADLWRSVLQADAAQLLDMQDHLLRDLVPKRDKVPVRLLVTGGGLSDRICYTSRPCVAKREDGSLPSLGETLREIVPGLTALPNPSQPAGSSSRTASAAEAQLRRLSTESEPPSPSANPPEEQLAEAASAPSALPEQAALPDGLTDDQMKATIAGVQPPLHSPMAWLHAAMHHPDKFLYIVLHLN